MATWRVLFCSVLLLRPTYLSFIIQIKQTDDQRLGLYFPMSQNLGCFSPWTFSKCFSSQKKTLLFTYLFQQILGSCYNSAKLHFFHHCFFVCFSSLLLCFLVAYHVYLKQKKRMQRILFYEKYNNCSLELYLLEQNGEIT